MKNILKITALLLVLVLSLSMVFACTPVEDEPLEDVKDQVEKPVEDEKEPEKENQILGREDNIKFDFLVTHANGEQVLFKVETTKDNLGDALLEGSIASGDEGEFGLYVTVVDGEEASWEKDQAYWYFYKDGEPLMEGVSSTPIANGDSFEAVYTK